MRFMMLVIPKDYAHAKPDAMPDAKVVEAMTKYNNELMKAGVLLSMDGLHPPSTGARVSFAGGKATVTDGPYAETKEQIGGILILEATDLNHAIQIMSKHPGVKAGPFEIRPAADLSDMIRESEARRAAAR